QTPGVHRPGGKHREDGEGQDPEQDGGAQVLRGEAVAEARQPLLPGQEPRGDDRDGRGGEPVPEAAGHPGDGHHQEGSRGRQLDALAGLDRGPVDDQDERGRSCDGGDRERRAEQPSQRAEHGDEGEGPQPRFLAAPFPLEPDEQSDADREKDPRQRLQCRPAADVHRLRAHPGGAQPRGTQCAAFRLPRSGRSSEASASERLRRTPPATCREPASPHRRGDPPRGRQLVKFVTGNPTGLRWPSRSTARTPNWKLSLGAAGREMLVTFPTGMALVQSSSLVCRQTTSYWSRSGSVFASQVRSVSLVSTGAWIWTFLGVPGAWDRDQSVAAFTFATRAT